MPLLLSYRRWWAIVFVAVLLLPAVGLFTPDMPRPLRTVLAPEARWWSHAARRLDPYINETFGFRGAVLAANAAYGRALNSPANSRPAFQGEKGQLFYRGDHALEKSLGQRVQPETIARLADFLAGLDARVRAVGGRLIVAPPPNPHTILVDLLPAWARAARKSPTEYDLLERDLKARGVPFLDLRPVMTAARKDGTLYRLTDTHWNMRGALVAYDAVMDALGRPDMRVDQAEMLKPRSPAPSGDLARLLGDVSVTGDVDYPLRDPDFMGRLTPIKGIVPPAKPKDPFVDYAYATGHGGPRVLVIGDSFTQTFWRAFLERRAGAFAWMHVRNCSLDLDAIDRFRPDIVIFTVNERALFCGKP